MRIREYFKTRELICRCGCGLMPNDNSIERLYALRILYGKPMIINSAGRCVDHNRAVGGSTGSIHLPAKHRVGASSGWGGAAFDIRVSSRIETAVIEALALKCGFTGFGYGNGFIHIDDAKRPEEMRWLYS
ncbi:MAG: D-Ala-D-Ala carboxypeptidase family metallohydrolase [Chitinispirillia bacterium]|nr:D-Ala-D-Ala carboxypeptidase family metallohydrolase [Chitinispirillia bacterium]